MYNISTLTEYDNQSGMNNKWTNIKEYTFNNIFFEDCEESFDVFKNILYEKNIKLDFDNLGSRSKDSYKKLYDYFREHNFCFSHSIVEKAVSFYFTFLMKQGLFVLNDTISKTLNGINIREELINFKKISNAISNFDIKKDIEKATDVYIKFLMSRSYYDGNIDVDIDRMNSEFKYLDIDKKIEHIESKEVKEYSKDEIDALEKRIIEGHMETYMTQIINSIKDKDSKNIEEDNDEKNDDNKRSL